MKTQILVTVRNRKEFADTFEIPIMQDYILQNLREELTAILESSRFCERVLADYNYPEGGKYADFDIIRLEDLGNGVYHFEVKWQTTIG